MSPARTCELWAELPAFPLSLLAIDQAGYGAERFRPRAHVGWEDRFCCVETWMTMPEIDSNSGSLFPTTNGRKLGVGRRGRGDEGRALCRGRECGEEAGAKRERRGLATPRQYQPAAVRASSARVFSCTLIPNCLTIRCLIVRLTIRCIIL